MDIVEKAIKLLQDNEPSEGYHLAFSGGKDSIVIKEITRLSGVKHKSHFARTSIDPPELLDYIHEYHPDVIWHRPELTMYQLILKNKMPPLRTARYCCKYLKEYLGNGEFVVTGIRAKESVRRSQREQIETSYNKKKKFIHPIFHWTDLSVWSFIRNNNLPYCSLYDEGFLRIGCIGCPMLTEKQSLYMFNRYPKHKRAYIKTFEKMMPTYKHKDNYENAEDLFNQWISNLNVAQWKEQKNQTKLEMECLPEQS